MGGVIGTIQATEAIKYVTGIGELLNGKLLTYNAKTMEFRKINIPRNTHCAICGEIPTITKLIDYELNVCG